MAQTKMDTLVLQFGGWVKGLRPQTSMVIAALKVVRMSRDISF